MATTDFVIADFRAGFPEFVDAAVYPDSLLTFWGEVGDSLLNIVRWGTRRVFGLQLFVAHNITLAKQHSLNAAAGGVPGTGVGVSSSQSVGPISESIDTQVSAHRDAGHYNLTTYGVQFWNLSSIVGMGGYQI